MTLIGVLFLLAFSACMTLRETLFPVLLGVAACFQGSQAVRLGTNGLTPFYLGAVMAIPLLFRRRQVLLARLRAIPIAGPLVLLIAYALLITTTSPELFKGLGVYAPRLGLSVSFTTPLAFSISNLTQCAYLLLGAAAMLYLFVADASPARVIAAAAWTGLFLAFLLWAAHIAYDQFPYTVIDNGPLNVYEVYTTRIRGTFTEPSYLGAFSVLAFAFFATGIVRADSSINLRAVAGALLAILIIVLSGSGTAVATLAVCLLLFAVAAVRSPLRHRPQGIPVGALGLLLVILSPGVLVLPKLVSTLANNFINRVSSQSQEFRQSADSNALHVFASTDGLGAGLGSDRASSLATTLLATIGLIGTALVAFIAVQALRGALRQRQRSLVVGAVVGLTAQIIAIPDLSFPFFWLALGCCLAGAVDPDGTDATAPRTASAEVGPPLTA